MYIHMLAANLRDRWQAFRSTKDSGYTSETIVVTAIMVAGALVVLAIIIAAITAKAESIDFG